jgi:hypothetical protein
MKIERPVFAGVSGVSIIDDHQHQMRVGDVTIDRMA